MALELTADLNAVDFMFDVTGTPAPTDGDFLQIEDELVYVVNAGPHGDDYRIESQRGVNATDKAAHAATTTVSVVHVVVQTDALASSPPASLLTSAHALAAAEVAANVPAIADPSGDAETGVNAIIAALVAAGLMEAES